MVASNFDKPLYEREEGERPPKTTNNFRSYIDVAKDWKKHLENALGLWMNIEYTLNTNNGIYLYTKDKRLAIQIIASVGRNQVRIEPEVQLDFQGEKEWTCADFTQTLKTLREHLDFSKFDDMRKQFE